MTRRLTRRWTHAAPGGWHRPRLFRVAVLFAMVAGGLLALTVGAQAERVYVAEIHGPIDLGMSPYLKRAIRSAEDAGARAVVLDINTPGGRLDAALQMKDAVLSSSVPVTAYVNREAFSAGALIAVAAEKIYMAPAGVMGAATPVIGDTGETASEKVVSAVRKDFKAIAEFRGRDPSVAEAMVDESVEVEGLVEAGKLLTLTASEALTWGYAEGVADSLQDVLEAEGLGGAEVVPVSLSWAEQLVRFLTNPVVASLLVSLGFLGLLFELTSPGFGVPGVAGAGLLALFFWGHMLAGLTGWEGVALALAGLLLIGLELFVVPGFGVVGLLGLLAFLGGLFISLVGRGAVGADFLRAGLVIAGAFAVMLAGTWVILQRAPRGRLLSRLVLHARLGGVGGAGGPGASPATGPGGPDAAGGRGAEGPASLIGARGVTLTDLRPAGMASINDRRVDVVTEGEFIAMGTEIEMIADEGYRRVVRQAQGTQQGSPGPENGVS